MQLEKELNRKIEYFLDKFIEMDETARTEFHSELSRVIMDSLERRSAEEEDLAPLKKAARLCVNRRVFGYEVTDPFSERLVKAVRELDESKGATKECRILWIRVMMAALEKPYIRDAAKDIRISHLNMFFYHALEAEADEDPNRDLMTWYEEFIDRGILYKYESRMFNRLAYFWLAAYGGQDHTDKAKAYFKAMERRGIDFENPYKGYYGKSDHEELIGYLLNDEYSEKRRRYLNEYVSGLAKEIAEDSVDDNDLWDLRRTVDELHRDNHYGKNDKAIDSWNRAVIDMCMALEKCCDKSENEKSAAAGVLVECLSEWDNWLLRYIELKNEDGNKEKYYGLIEEWEQRIGKISNDRAWVMLSSLREILINRYYKTGETDKLINMLEKHTSDMDSATHLRDWLLIEDIKGKRYCTHNTMALINQLMEKGDRKKAKTIISEIASNAKEVEACSYYLPDNIRNLWLKYILLLEKHGYVEETEYWKEKLKSEYEMKEADIACEISYLHGEYEEAIRNCNGEKNTKEMLEYITAGILPTDVNQKEIEILGNKEPDRIHCRGCYVGENMRVERQLTNAEWHKFYADMKTLTEIFEKGFKGEAPYSIYPPEYYKAELSFGPEPPIMRGDYIKYFDDNNGMGKWFGLTDEDFAKIGKAISETSKIE